ncbi:hypothetical protein [Streptomyces sp. ISL-11]|uniref:hypothetical protein n=1 Tax=Streptomyces sp. ISL-11 TaxID=2819174 RepID=UPI00203502A6|nr:hypothetical protein [Streptomyces sp. ISL-11]
MVALASVVALAVVLPLAAATAGPAGLMSPEKSGARTRGAQGAAADGGQARERPDRDPARGAGGERGERYGAQGTVEAGDASDDSKDLSQDGAGASAGLGGPGAGSTRCGPEVSSPAGVEAQTCVLERGRDTWGRTYYRNASGGPLTAVLTLMGPDGRTVEVHCQAGASDDPGGCETPHRATVRGQGAYTAVAEFASAEGNLLLRSGSNSPDDPLE